MAQHFNLFSQDDPFRPRELKKQGEQPHNSASEELNAERQKESVKDYEKLREEAEALHIPEQAKELVAHMDALHEAGKWDAEASWNVEWALTELTLIDRLEEGSPEYDFALDAYREAFADKEMSNEDIVAVSEAVQKTRQDAEQMLMLKEAHSNRELASIYLVGSDGERVSPELEALLFQGGEWTVDFGGNSVAEKRVGLKDMIPADVQEVTITKKSGGIVKGFRHTNGNFYTKDWSYLSVLTGDKITLKETQFSEPSGQEKQLVEKAHEIREYAPIYLVGEDGERVSPELEAQVTFGGEWTVDFAGNKDAESSVGLKDMMPSDVQEITLIKNGTEVQGSRRENGNFYTQKGEYLAVHSGDKIRVATEESPAVSDEIDFHSFEEQSEVAKAQIEKIRIEDPALADRQAEALRRVELGKANARARRADALARANALERRSSSKIPEQLHGLSGYEYSQTLLDMDYGSQVMDALSTLAKMSGRAPGQEVDMWEDIRKQNLAKETVSFGEITRASLKQNPQSFLNEYQALSDKITVLDEGHAALEMAQISYQAENGTLDGFNAEAYLNSAFMTQLPVEQRAHFIEMRPYIRGEKDSSTLRTQLKDMEDFMVAAEALLDGVNNLAARQREYESKRLENNPERNQAEYLMAQVFDRFDQGPRYKRMLLQSREDRVMNMQLYMEKMEYRSELDKKMSGAAAYNRLRFEVSDPASGEINHEKLISRLNELLQKGLMVAASDPELMEKIGEPSDYRTLDSSFLENQDLTELDVELIQRGMAFEQGESFLAQRQEEIEFLEKKYDPLTGQALKTLAATHQFTPEELEEMGDKLHEHMLFNVGLMQRTHTHSEYLDGELQSRKSTVDRGLGLDVPIDLGHGVTFRAGITDNVFTGQLTLHAGASKRWNLGKRAHLDTSLGAFGGRGRANAGADLNFSVDLGKYSQNTVSVGAGAGLTPGTLLSAAVLHAGTNRNLEGVVERKGAKLNEKQREEMDRAMASYKEQLIAAGLKPEQYEEYLEQLDSFFQNNIDTQAIDDLSKVQFLGAGVAVVPVPSLTPPVLVVPYVKMGLKGKPHLVYAMKEDLNKTLLADHQIEAALAAQEGQVDLNPVYVSGDIELTEKGLKTMQEDFRVDSLAAAQLESFNSALRPHGLNLETVETPEGTRLKLNVNRVTGTVDIFADPHSGLETYVGDDGEVYVNVEPGQELSMRRVDEFTPFENFGSTQRTKIYISDNVKVPNGTIESESSTHIQFKEDLTFTDYSKRSKAEVVTEGRATQNAEAVFADASSLEAAGLSADMFEDVAELKAAADELHEAMGKGPRSSLSAARRGELETMAAALLIDNPISYRQLSVEMDYKEITTLVQKSYPDQSFSNRDLAYMQQALMMATLADAPGSFKEHITGWNQQALARNLEKNGLTKLKAKSISKKIMENYAAQSEGELSAKSIERGAIVQIQVGTKKVEGYREAFFDPTNAPGMLLTVDLTQPAAMESMGLDAAEQEAFLGAFVDQMSPLGESPADLFQSQLGLAVLDAADLIFGAEKTRELAQMLKNPDSAQGETYEEYKNLVQQLRDKGSLTLDNGLILNVKTTKEMGFIDACQNFTMVMNEKLSLSLPEGQAVSTELLQYLEGHSAADVYAAGVAATAAKTKSVNKTETPEGDTPPDRQVGTGGRKNPVGEQYVGQIEPNEVRPGEIPGHGSETPTE